MKKYIFAAAAVLSAASFTACDDMLDTDPRVTDATQATFPGKIGDVEALNAATYSIMNTLGGGDSDNQNIFYWWEIMSDNCYGAGGLQDNKIKSLHHLTTMDANQYETPFIVLYGGVNRANNMIETIDNVTWPANQKTKRDQLLGEAFFMRGLYNLWLTQLFGNVPLITSTTITPEMEEQAIAKDQIYPQIFSDFTSAINLMGTQKSSGHANQYVAQAFLARAYMFYEGFYGKIADLSTASPEAIQLIEQEGCSGTLTKQNVVDGLKQIKESKAYKLLDDYRSLWQYSNSLVWKEAHDEALDQLTGEDLKDLQKWRTYGNKDGGHAYDFIADMNPDHCFDMPGMGNGNDEEMFQIQFMNASRWGIGGAGGIYSSDRMYCNYLSCFWALRVNGNNGNREYTYPFTQGWGQGTPSCNIWDDWTAAERDGGYTDMRKLGSLIDVEEEFSADHGLKGYTYVKDDCEESGYGVKKFNGVTTDAMTGDTPWWHQAGGDDFKGTLDNPMQGEHFEDYYLMRYADVLLMLSELTGDPEGLNEVRERGLGYRLNKAEKYTPIPYSLKAVQDERRWEFAFEGLRFNDMRRWSGEDGGESCYAAKALQAQNGKKITCLGQKGAYTMNHMTCSWAKRYADTDGFLAIPQAQITLMNGKLVQNRGWDLSNSETQYKTLY